MAASTCCMLNTSNSAGWLARTARAAAECIRSGGRHGAHSPLAVQSKTRAAAGPADITQIDPCTYVVRAGAIPGPGPGLSWYLAPPANKETNPHPAAWLPALLALWLAVLHIRQPHASTRQQARGRSHGQVQAVAAVRKHEADVRGARQTEEGGVQCINNLAASWTTGHGTIETRGTKLDTRKNCTHVWWWTHGYPCVDFSNEGLHSLRCFL